MQSFRVEHKATGRSYFVMAEDASLALERVTLTLADVEGRSAWDAQPSTPEFAIPPEEVVDSSGTPVKTLNA